MRKIRTAALTAALPLIVGTVLAANPVTSGTAQASPAVAASAASTTIGITEIDPCMFGRC